MTHYDEVILLSGLDSLTLYHELGKKPQPVYFKWGFDIDEAEIAILPVETIILEVPDYLQFPERKGNACPNLDGRDTVMYNIIFQTFKPSIIYNAALKNESFYHESRVTYTKKIAELWSGLLGKECEIRHPFLQLNKRHIVKKAEIYGIDISKMQYCYNVVGNCGVCDKCRLLRGALIYTKKPDVKFAIELNDKLIKKENIKLFKHYNYLYDTPNFLKDLTACLNDAPKYCVAPFISPAVTPQGFRICSYPGQKTYPDISFWNSNEVKNIRQQIIDGEIPDGCKSCRSMRDGLVVSKIKPTSVEVPVNFESLYLARSNKCDFACEMCSGEISHSYDKKYDGGVLGVVENDFDLLPYLSETKSVAISGGNPVLDKKLIPIIEALDPDKVDHFIITTNGSVFPDSFLNVIKNKKFTCKPTLIFSMDGPKEINEVVRSGAKQERIYNTINTVLSKIEVEEEIYVAIEFTATNKTIHHFESLYNEMLFGIAPEYHNRVYIIMNMCTSPEKFSVTRITDAEYQKVLESARYLNAQNTHLASQFLAQLKKFKNYYDTSRVSINNL